MKKIGIGVIGTGFARKVQIPAFAACDGATVISVASRDLKNARSTAEEFGIVHFTSDWRLTVSHPDVDLVVITTPPDLHREMTLFAIGEERSVLCEKPMAMNVAEAEEMAAAAAGKPILAIIDHELRFQPGRQIAYGLLRDGAIGKVRHAKALFQAPHRGDPSLPWNWWSDASVGGGALGAIASHVIDSFNWFLDTDVNSVICQLQTHIKQRTDTAGEPRTVSSDDESNMLLRFADGELTADATGLVSISMSEYPKYRNRIEFYGTQGAMRIEHRGELFIARAGNDKWESIEVDLGRPIPGVADTGFSRGFMEFVPEIIKAMQEKNRSVEFAASFPDGLRVQRVLDAARESNSTGRVILL